MTPPVRLELEQLLSGLCDETLSDEQHARLEALLAADEECRRRYLEYLDLHAHLLAGPNRLAAAVPTRAPASRRWRRAGAYLGLVVATLAASFALQLAWWKGHLPKADWSTDPAAAVATLSQTTDCAWELPGRVWQAGQRVGPDELRLARGIARLRFDTGQELVLEGPAALRIEGAAAATLLTGKFVFRADDTGPPFELHTPTAALIDLGTEYGVFVDAGTEEVHVFEGEVRRTPRAAAEPEVLTAGEARRYRTAAKGQPATLDAPRFVRRLPGSARPNPADGLLAHEGFDYARSDALLKGDGTGGFGWAGAWRGPQAPFKHGRPQPALNPSGGLTRPGGPSTGGAFESAGFAKYSRRLATPIPLNEDGIYYLSFLFRRQQPPPDTTNAIVVALKASDDGRYDRAGHCRRLSLGIGGENHLCTHLHGAGSRMPLPLGYDQTYLLAAKVVARQNRPCQVFVRVYGPEEPVESDETMHWTAAGQPVRADLVLNWVEIQVNGRRRQELDEIRLGTSWASVTAPWAGRAGP